MKAGCGRILARSWSGETVTVIDCGIPDGRGLVVRMTGPVRTGLVGVSVAVVGLFGDKNWDRRIGREWLLKVQSQLRRMTVEAAALRMQLPVGKGPMP